MVDNINNAIKYIIVAGKETDLADILYLTELIGSSEKPLESDPIVGYAKTDIAILKS